MTRGNKKSPWSSWTERDDREWLNQIENFVAENSQNPNKTLSSPYPSLVQFIVSSQESRGQTPRGVGFLPPNIFQLVKQFNTWISLNGELTQLKKKWALDAEGPWSLPLALSRMYRRFKNHSLEKSPRFESFQARHLEASISKAFEAMTDCLRDNPLLCLTYKLHLEGLWVPEISKITGISEQKTQELIQQAKSELLGEPSKKPKRVSSS